MAGRCSTFRLYLVTDRTQTAGRPLATVVEAALAGGVDAVQLREKDLPSAELLDLATRLHPLCKRYHVPLLINDRVDIALAVGAEGVHLPADSFTPADARRLLGPEALIGASTHSLAEAQAAGNGGADFIVFGPVFDTQSKRAFGAPTGLEALAEVARAVALPVLAIGGINAQRATSIRARGADGVAVVSAVLAAPRPELAAAALRAAL